MSMYGYVVYDQVCVLVGIMGMYGYVVHDQVCISGYNGYVWVCGT